MQPHGGRGDVLGVPPARELCSQKAPRTSWDFKMGLVF